MLESTSDVSFMNLASNLYLHNTRLRSASSEFSHYYSSFTDDEIEIQTLERYRNTI